MAPRNPDRPDDRIDMRIDLIGSQSLDAINALSSQLEKLTAHLATVSQMNPDASAQGQRNLAARVGPSGITEAGRSPNSSFSAWSREINDGRGRQASRPPTGTPGRDPDAGYRELDTQSALKRTADYAFGGQRAAIDPGLPAGPARDAASRPPQGVTGWFDREIDLYRARESEQARRRTSTSIGRGPRMQSIQGGHNIDRDLPTPGGSLSNAGVSPTASRPDRAEPGWLQGLRSNPEAWERSQESFQLPQFGEFTIQNKLEMGSDFLTRSAYRAYQRSQPELIEARRTRVREALAGRGLSEQEIDQRLQSDRMQAFINQAGAQSTAGLGRGRTAMALQMAANQSAQIQVAGREAQRLFRWGTGINQAGMQTGYEPGGEIGPFGGIVGPDNLFGVRLPNLDGLHLGRMFQGGSLFTNDPYAAQGAATEGLRQRVNAMRLRMRGGINGEQASTIVQGLAQRGWTGREGERAALDIMSPLVQAGNPDPEGLLALFDQSVRGGNTSMEEFLETMQTIPSAARSARMSVQDFQRGLQQFTETAQQQGGLAGAAQQAGIRIHEEVGVSPQVGAGLISNPLVQGMGMANSGVIPQFFSAATPETQIDAIYSAFDLAAEQGGVFTDQRNEKGEVTITAAAQRDAFIAQRLNTTPDEVARIRRMREVREPNANARRRLREFERLADAVPKKRSRGDGGRGKGDGMLPGPLDKIGNAAEKAGGWLAQQVGLSDDPNEKRDEYIDSLDKPWAHTRRVLSDRKLTGSGKGRERYLKRLDEIEDIDDPKKRAEAARKLLNERMRQIQKPKDDRPSVKLDLTKRAAQYFRQIDKKYNEDREADQGAKPRSEKAAGHNTEIDPGKILEDYLGLDGN